jgi:hypothetical protein
MADSAVDGRWLTYDEIAAVRGTQKVGAIRWVQRHRWRRQPGNDGLVRVLVPPDALTPTLPQRRSAPTVTPDSAAAFETALAAIEAAHARELATLQEQVASAEQARAAMRAMLEQFAGQLRDVDQVIKADRARSDALLAETTARADRAEAAITGERARTNALRNRLEQAQADLVVAQHDAQAGQQAAAELRQAEEARKARGRLRRAWDGWRGT